MQRINDRFISNPAYCTWLWAMVGLIILMILVGGLTRLYDAGLSMVHWQPLRGVIPPLTDSAWETLFREYKTYPQYQFVMKGLSLATFKGLFFWEWGHRMLGRIVGIIALLGAIVFGYHRRYSAILIFFGVVIQGVMGWVMVKSGLIDQPTVSSIRLTLHLWLAVGLILYCLHTLIQSGGLLAFKARNSSPPWVRWGLRLVLGLLVLQMTYGGFMAGLDAGVGFNTFPLMGGQWIPVNWYHESWIHTLIFHPPMVQWLHRIVGMISGLVGTVLWGAVCLGSVDTGLKKWITVCFIGLLLQIVLGILTLIHVVPVGLAILHQLGGIMVLSGYFLVLQSQSQYQQ